MDFFERFFHINLDGGNGSLEALYLLAFAAAAVALIGFAVRRRRI